MTWLSITGLVLVALALAALALIIAVFSCMHPLPGAQASRLPTNRPEKQPRWLRSQDSLM